MKCNFIGSFRLEELPNTAKPGDIAQLRLNKDQVYRDGYGNLAVDKDFVMLSEDGWWNRKDIDTIFYEINKDKDDFNELFNDLLCKIGNPNYKINKNKRIPRFLGVYNYNDLPKDASSGDIVQIRIPTEKHYADGKYNTILDKDLIIMTDRHGWVLFGSEDKFEDKDNSYIMYIGSPININSNPFDIELKNLKILNRIVKSFRPIKVIVIKSRNYEIVMDSQDPSVFDKYLKRNKYI